jgi:SH3 domain protein
MNMQLKRLAMIGLFVTVFSATGFAENMYVSDVLKVTVRTGPGTEYKIIAVAESGESLEIIEKGEEWSLVRLQNGREGHVMTRYLTPDPTYKVLYEQLQVKHKALTEQTSALFEENARLKEENKELKSTLDGTEKSLEKVEGNYQELKAGSSEFLSLKTNFKKVSEQLSEQTKKADRLEKELKKVELNQYIKWFLAGSGVLLVGFIVGFSARRQRRRPSLL